MNALSFSSALSWAVKLTALSAFAFALLKTLIIVDSFNLLTALVFAGLHLPLCLFSILIVCWFFDAYQAVGFLALTSALLNALLI